MILTIAIPTYNRPNKVLNTVKALLPQLSEDVKILILDNCSDIVVSEFLDISISNIKNHHINVIRHRVNIGPDANFARAFELCDTPWIWTLSDDDLVMADAVSVILNEIERYKSLDMIGFNFNSNCNQFERLSPIQINSIESLTERLDSFGNWLFISTAVYNVTEYLRHIRYAMWGAYSMASQIVPAMIAIQHGKTFILSEKRIADNVPIDDISTGWSFIQLTYSLPVLLEAPVGFKQDEYLKFGRKFGVHYTSFPDILFSMIKSVDMNIDLLDNFHIYVFQMVYQRSFKFRIDSVVKQELYYRIGIILLRFKLITKALMKNRWFNTKVHNALKHHLFLRTS